VKNLFIFRAAASMKTEIILVLGTLSLLFILPIVALFSLTNLDALADSNLKLYTGPASTANTYIYGYCTFWAAKRREEVSLPIPNNWGDAHTWDDNAKLAGYTVDHTPAEHAIMQTDAGELGHVAFVESVSLDGGWTVSEMNVKGWDIISGRTFTKDDAEEYEFIH